MIDVAVNLLCVSLPVSARYMPDTGADIVAVCRGRNVADLCRSYVAKVSAGGNDISVHMEISRGVVSDLPIKTWPHGRHRADDGY